MAYIEKKAHYKTWFIFLIIVLFIVILFSCSIGAANINILDAFKIIIQKIPVIGTMIYPNEYPRSAYTIIWNIRIPRILLSMFGGASLAIAGVTYQGLFKNPMAEPYVLGISAGAAFGGTLSIVLGISTLLGFSGIGIMAFAGATATTFFVYQLGKKEGSASMTFLLLAGIAISSLLSALISLMMIFNREQLDKIILWTMGSFASATWEKVGITGSATFIGMTIIYFFGKDLNVLLIGDEDAKHLGIEVDKVKKILLVLASFVSSITVSASGIIGFVGLIIPHAMRLVVGPDHRVLLPYSAIVGAIFLVIADTMARTLAAPIEIPVGVITALFGAPFFIYLLRRSKRANIAH